MAATAPLQLAATDGHERYELAGAGEGVLSLKCSGGIELCAGMCHVA